MRLKYVCEKCGLVFDSGEDCTKCEEGHVNFAETDSYEPEVKARSEWNPGVKFPERIIVPMSNGRKWNTEKGRYDEEECVFATYEIVRELNSIEADAIRKEHDARVKKEQEDMERWRQMLNEKAGKLEQEPQSALCDGGDMHG